MSTWSYASKNVSTYNYQSKNPLAGEIAAGSPMGLLLAITYSSTVEGWNYPTKNTSTYSYPTKN
jgi:hypothetical protein